MPAGPFVRCWVSALDGCAATAEAEGQAAEQESTERGKQEAEGVRAGLRQFGRVGGAGGDRGVNRAGYRCRGHLDDSGRRLVDE